MISFAAYRPAPEVRSDATSMAITSILSAATGQSVRTWATGAVEVAAGLWARTLSTAEVPPDVPIGPRWLAEVARDVARHGEAVYVLTVAPRGRVRLIRAAASDVWGDEDPETWFYRLTLAGPHRTRTVTAPAASVFHCRYATEKHAPARGISPLQYASLTGRLNSAVEQSLGFEAGGPVANLIALPEGFNAQPPPEDPDDDPDHPLPADDLAEAIRIAKGRLLMPETLAGSYGDKGAAPPRRDFEPQRLGANPPQSLIQLRQQVEPTVLGCYGVPAPLGPMGVNDGTAMRESIRRLWTTTITPLAALVSEELSRVLERPIKLEHGAAAGLTDVAARARAVKALVEVGIDKAEAMRRVGWSDA